MRLLDYLYNANCKTLHYPSFLKRLYVDSIVRHVVFVLTNFLIPTLFNITKQWHRIRPNESNVIVSLTSFPQRIDKVWILIECLIRQNMQPEHLILWLSREQFASIEVLPQELKEQMNRGLEIRLVEGDLRSYKKFYYAFQEFPEFLVITVDDDFYLPSDFISGLVNSSRLYPDSVICTFACRFDWSESIQYIKWNPEPIHDGERSNHIFFGSGGGTVFRPKKLLPYTYDTSLFRTLCPTADDMFLNGIIRLAGFDVVSHKQVPLLEVKNSKNRKLDTENGNIFHIDSKNADQLRALISYCKEKYRINPFKVN